MIKKQAMKKPQEADIYLGQRIREARNELGMSQSTLADKLGVTFQQIQKYEKGINRVGGSRLVQLSEALNRPTNFFFKSGGTRDTANPDVEKFITSKRGYYIASHFGKVPPAIQDAMINLIEASYHQGGE